MSVQISKKKLLLTLVVSNLFVGAKRGRTCLEINLFFCIKAKRSLNFVESYPKLFRSSAERRNNKSEAARCILCSNIFVERAVYTHSCPCY